MYDKLRRHIDMLFEEAPPTKKAVEIKEEILQNLYDKYNDLIADGKNEESAYNIVVAGIGDLSDLIKELKEGEKVNREEYSKEREVMRKRSALFTSIAIGLYIICVIPIFMFQNNLGLIFMFVLAGLATALLIYNSMIKTPESKMDATMAEEFKEWRDSNSNRKQVLKSISSAVWALGLVLYVVVSFATRAWHITWIVFPLIGAVNSIIRAVYDFKR